MAARGGGEGRTILADFSPRPPFALWASALLRRQEMAIEQREANVILVLNHVDERLRELAVEKEKLSQERLLFEEKQARVAETVRTHQVLSTSFGKEISDCLTRWSCLHLGTVR